MTCRDFNKIYEINERLCLRMDEYIIFSVLYEFMQRKANHSLTFHIDGDMWQAFLNNHYSIETEEERKLFYEILDYHNACYNFTIDNAIYNMLGLFKDNRGSQMDPMAYPGVNDYYKHKNKYLMNTRLGTITVYKASALFTKTSSSTIFYRKPLVGMCYARTYDFLKKNKEEYKAVLSYEPNLFYGGHYHAYLEAKDHVIDIAANAFYESKEEAKKVLIGQVLAKLTLDEIEEQYEKIASPDLNQGKLHSLALHYGMKNNNKEV